MYSTPRRAVSELVQGWRVTALDGPVPASIAGRDIPATVPGCVHTDLLAAGLIADPFLDENEETQFWVGSTSWRYAVDIDLPAGPGRTDLRLDGVDTISEIRLNGRPIGSTRNMHRRYRFDLRPALQAGRNRLEVDFAAPRVAAAELEAELGARPHAYPHPFNAIRKMASSFGWDWGPDTATSGLWRTAAIERWEGARIAEARVLTSWNAGRAVAEVIVDVERDDERELAVHVRVAGAETSIRLDPGATRAVLRLEPRDAEVWSPAGHGTQALYDAEIELHDEAELLDATTRRVGFRTIEARMTPDADGTGFVIVVNGVDVVVKGANWIPDDAFLHRVTRDRLARRLDQARFAGINLLRVWGGGVFESDDFYELCAERGILVWQDFLAACAAYSEDEPQWSEFEAEARDNVARLASQPALAVLNGNNECLWGIEEWSWTEDLAGRSWGHRYYYELFPAIVAELAPHVVYVPGSPFSPDPDVLANDERHGTSHIWTLVRDTLDYATYASSRPRFVAEFGWQGPPTWATLRAAISDDPLSVESPAMEVHQKAPSGNHAIADAFAARFGTVDTFDDWHWAGALLQANAIGFAIEHFRSLHPLCTGTIVWQLNDCWPVVSWSAIDWGERPKPLLHALRRVYADRLVTIQPREQLAAVVLNDTAEPWSAEVRIERRRYDGVVLGSARESIRIPARGSATIPIPSDVAASGDPASEYLRVEVDGVVARRFFVDYAGSALDLPELDARLDREGRRYRLTLTPDSVVRDLALLVDRIDPAAQVDEMLLTLDAGQTATISFDSDRDLAVDDLLDPRVLRSANDLVVAAFRAGVSRPSLG